MPGESPADECSMQAHPSQRSAIANHVIDGCLASIVQLEEPSPKGGETVSSRFLYQGRLDVAEETHHTLAPVGQVDKGGPPVAEGFHPYQPGVCKTVQSLRSSG